MLLLDLGYRGTRRHNGLACAGLQAHIPHMVRRFQELPDACVVRQGITQLGLIFMQMGAVSFSVAIVDLLTAAVRWPGVALVVAVGVAGVSVVRMLALAVLVTRCSDRGFPPQQIEHSQPNAKATCLKQVALGT